MSKFFQALQEADRERALDQPDQRPTEEGPVLEPSSFATSEMCQRMTRWIEEGQVLARALPLLLVERDHLRQRAETAEHQSLRLREEFDEVAETLGQLLQRLGRKPPPV